MILRMEGPQSFFVIVGMATTGTPPPDLCPPSIVGRHLVVAMAQYLGSSLTNDWVDDEIYLNVYLVAKRRGRLRKTKATT